MRPLHSVLVPLAAAALAACTPSGFGAGGSYNPSSLGPQSTRTGAGITASYQGGANPVVQVVTVDARPVSRVEIVGPSGAPLPANLSMHREDLSDPNRMAAQAAGPGGGYGGSYGGYPGPAYSSGMFIRSFSVAIGGGSASGVGVGVGFALPMVMAALASATGPQPHPAYGYGAPPAGGGGAGMTRTTASLILDDAPAYGHVWRNARVRVTYEGGATDEIAAPAPG